MESSSSLVLDSVFLIPPSCLLDLSTSGSDCDPLSGFHRILSGF